MDKSETVHCFLNSSDGVARWGLETVGRRAFLSSTELGLEGLVESIAVVFKELLKREGLSVADIKQVAFILGPGSFTSLRTSYSFLKGLIEPTNIKLVGVSSFLAYLIGSELEHLGQINLTLNANAQENFVAEFNVQSKTTITAMVPISLSIEETESKEYSKLPAIIETSCLMDAVNFIPNLSPETHDVLARVGHLYVGPGACELLYIKGVSAKTLKERGVSLN